MLRANPITLIHNDLFPVANVSYCVATDLTYICGFEYIMNPPEQNINSLPSHTQLAGHLHWHRSSSLFLTGADQPQRQCTVGKVSCRTNSYGPPNCCPMPVSGSWFKMGKLPWLNV